MNMRNQIAELLMKKRIQAGLSPEEAATLLDLPVEILLKYEKGHTEIALNHIFAAANVYNIDPSAIMEILAEIDMNQASTSVEVERMSKIKI